MTAIFPMVPFRQDKNLGRAYNECMALLPDDAWAIFQDHDAMPTTPHWFRQFREAIEFLPDAGAFVACTNRIASPWQRVGDENSNDIAAHRAFGAERVKLRTLLDISGTKGFGGVLFTVSKAAWKEVGGFADGMYCCDHSLFFRLVARGRRVFMLDGLYVYHFRGSSNMRPPLAAPKVPNCPCRGPEVMPTERISLP
jgi:GT2 family glycosyltransferase